MMKLLGMVLLAVLTLSGCQTVNQNVKEAGNEQEISNQEATQTDSQSPKKIAYLEGLVEEFPEDPSVHLQLGKAYLQEAKASQSHVFLKKAIASLEHYAQMVPSDLSVKVALYDLYYRQVVNGDYSYQTKLKRMHLAIPSQYGEQINPPTLAVAVHQLKTKQIKDYETITNLLKKAVSEAPYNVPSNTMLADFYGRQELYRLAVPLLEKVNKHTPDHPVVLEFLGETLMKQEMMGSCPYTVKRPFAKAQTYLRQAVKINPQSAKARESLSSIYELWGRGNLQLNEAKKLVQIEDNSHSQRLLANAYLSSGRMDEAKDIYQSLLDTELRPEALSGLSQLHFYQSEWTDFERNVNSLREEGYAHFYDYLLKSLSQEKLDGHDQAEKAFVDEVGRLELYSWQQSLFDYRLGNISADELLSKAGDVCDQTEAEFYIGFVEYLNGNKQAAKARMQRVLDLKVYGFIEYHAAKSFSQSW